MRLKLLAAAVAAAAITAPAFAQAATVVENATIPISPVPYTYAFSLPSFNTALGTLQSVTFELTDSTTAAVQIFNATAGALSFTNATASIPLTVTGPGGMSISDTITASVASGVATSGLNTFSGVTGTHSANTSFTSGLSAFESGSVVNLSYLADASQGTYTGTGPTGLFFGGSANAGGTFEIIYNYAAVPEPATWAFLMLGLGGIGAAMRTRRKGGLALTAA